MSMLSRPHPAFREDVFELPSAGEGSGKRAAPPDGLRERKKSRAFSRSPKHRLARVFAAAAAAAEHLRDISADIMSDRQAGLILLAALSALPGFVPEPAVAASGDLYISGGGGGGGGTAASYDCGGDGGTYAGKGGGYVRGDGSGGGGAYVGDGTEPKGENGGDAPWGVGPGGSGHADNAPTGDGVSVSADNGSSGFSSNGGDGGDARLNVDGDFSGYDTVSIMAGNGGLELFVIENI